MSILISNQISQALDGELNNCKQSFILITAYCKLSALGHLDSLILGNGIEKTLIVRMQPLDVLKRSTDLDVCKYCLDNDWTILFNKRVHAKLYLFDKARFVIGSANATNSGLGIDCEGNYEMAIVCDADLDDCSKVEKLINESTQINESMYLRMKEYIDSLRKQINPDPILYWPEDIFYQSTQAYAPFSVEDFPPNLNPFEDLSKTKAFLKTDSISDKNSIKLAFAKTKCYQWLVSLLRETENHYKQYGPIRREDLMGKFVEEETKETVTRCLTNLQEWLKELEMPDIGVYQPNHSHIFYLRDSVGPEDIDKQHEKKKADKRTGNL